MRIVSEQVYGTFGSVLRTQEKPGRGRKSFFFFSQAVFRQLLFKWDFISGVKQRNLESRRPL